MKLRFWGTRGSIPVALTAPGMRARLITVLNAAAGRNLDPNDVARLNGIPVNAELKAGQEIKVPSTASAPSRRR